MYEYIYLNSHIIYLYKNQYKYLPYILLRFLGIFQPVDQHIPTNITHCTKAHITYVYVIFVQGLRTLTPLAGGVQYPDVFSLRCLQQSLSAE